MIRFRRRLFFLGWAAALLCSDRLIAQKSSDTARQLFSSYDRFLAILNDEDKRKKLESLRIEDASISPLFVEIREIGHAFQGALTRFFFYDSDEWRDLVLKYGIF